MYFKAYTHISPKKIEFDIRYGHCIHADLPATCVKSHIVPERVILNRFLGSLAIYAMLSQLDMSSSMSLTERRFLESKVILSNVFPPSPHQPNSDMQKREFLTRPCLGPAAAWRRHLDSG